MKAFITGSHAYGSPGEGSDVDLVVLGDINDWHTLKGISQSDICLVFGNLNLIFCTEEAEFQAWSDGTKRLMKRNKEERRPIGRKEAKEFFDTIRAEYGVEDNYSNGEDFTGYEGLTERDVLED